MKPKIDILLHSGSCTFKPQIQTQTLVPEPQALQGRALSESVEIEVVTDLLGKARSSCRTEALGLRFGDGAPETTMS